VSVRGWGPLGDALTTRLGGLAFIAIVLAGFTASCSFIDRSDDAYRHRCSSANVFKPLLRGTWTKLIDLSKRPGDHSVQLHARPSGWAKVDGYESLWERSYPLYDFSGRVAATVNDVAVSRPNPFGLVNSPVKICSLELLREKVPSAKVYFDLTLVALDEK
jgi:hypothetical protein